MAAPLSRLSAIGLVAALYLLPLPCSATCAVGRQLTNASQCSPCPPGTSLGSVWLFLRAPLYDCARRFIMYKNSVSNAAHCTECPVHQMTLSTASKDQAACVCEPGHSGEYCSPCEHGYKPDPGPASCTSCSIFDENSVTTSSTTGAVSSGSCVCEMGYTGSPPACAACAAGNYKDAEANKMSCTPCGINTFSPKIAATGPLTCQQCLSNTSSEVASNAAAICRCDQGFGGSVQGSAVAISNCSLCQPGTFYSVRYVFFFFFSSSSLN